MTRYGALKTARAGQSDDLLKRALPQAAWQEEGRATFLLLIERMLSIANRMGAGLEKYHKI